MKHWLGRNQGESAPNHLHRDVVPAGLVGDDAQIVQTVGVIGFLREDLPESHYC